MSKCFRQEEEGLLAKVVQSFKIRAFVHFGVLCDFFVF